MVAMQMTVNLLGICSTVVLVRLLTPEDFGIVALASSAYAFFVLFGQFGFDMPLIQRQDVDRSHYDTAWTANILVGAFTAIAMISVARPVSLFFQDQRVEYVIYSFSLLSLAKGLENIGIVNFRKQLAFRGEFLYFVLPKLTSLFVGVTAAFILRSYWALVIGMISAQIVALLYSHFSQPFRPRLSLSRFSELFGFTRWILGMKILRYLNISGIEIILGRFSGPAAVGLYGIASQVAHLPSTEIAAPMKRALFPSLATISGDRERLRSAFVKVYAVTLLFAVPAAFGIMAIADSFVHVLFGDQWAQSAPILAIMALVGLVEVVNLLGEPVLIARAALRPLFLALAGHTVILLVSAILFISAHGVIGAAYAMLVSSLVAMPLYIFATKSEIGFRLGELGRYLWRPLIASILMAIAVKQLESKLVGAEEPTIPILFALVGTGVVAYPVLLLLLWAASGRPAFPELTVIDMAKAFVNSRRNRSAVV